MQIKSLIDKLRQRQQEMLELFNKPFEPLPEEESDDDDEEVEEE